MIHVHELNFAAGSFALEEVSLEIDHGEYFVLLGPSGSGKTLLLESLCGLNRIDSGRILIGDRDVTALEPRKRSIGYLPQDYALFPHITVRRNIGFGLKGRLPQGVSVAEVVDDLAQLTEVSHLIDRLPGNLSGGEKQRVALARALAIRPKALLLDEPVSALDEQTRDTLCRVIKRLQRETHTTTLHVCHNFAEMLTVADRAGVINDGRIIQVGTTGDILQRPRNRMVAEFVKAANIFAADARVDGSLIHLRCAGGLEFRAAAGESSPAAGPVEFMVRPENIHVDTKAPTGLPPGTSVVAAVVRQVDDLGPLVELVVDCKAGAALTVSLGKRQFTALGCNTGDNVHLAVTPADVHVLRD